MNLRTKINVHLMSPDLHLQHGEFTKVCFVCGKERDRKGERKLILVATKDREDTILRKAKELDDFAMLHMIQGHGERCTDLIANDFRYHKSCLTLYLLKSRPSSTEQDQPIDSEQRVDEYERALKETVSKVEGKLLNENTVFFVSQLRDMVRQGLSDRQVNHAIQKSSNQLVKAIRKLFWGQDNHCSPGGYLTVGVFF